MEKHEIKIRITVAPHAGAGIEITDGFAGFRLTIVAPHAGAGIEILSGLRIF